MSTNQQSKSKTDQSRSLPKTNEQSALRFYQGDRLATEVGAQGNRSLMWGSETAVAQRDGAQEAHLLQTDLPGSVLGMQQAMLRSMAYSPYGYRAANETGALLGFNGQRPEPVAGGYLLGNGHRLFSPTLMRFCGADSLSPFEEGGLNAYAYCEGDPINFGDPAGQSPFAFLMGLLKFKPAARLPMSIQAKNPQPDIPSAPSGNSPRPSSASAKSTTSSIPGGQRRASTSTLTGGVPTGQQKINTATQTEPNKTHQSNTRPRSSLTRSEISAINALDRELVAIDREIFNLWVKPSFINRNRGNIVKGAVIAGLTAIAIPVILILTGTIPDPINANKDARST